jgi:hypothetical protein
MTVVPAISGCQVRQWDNLFLPQVEFDDCRTPLRGIVGFGWLDTVRFDLRDLAILFLNDRHNMLHFLSALQSWHNSKPYGPAGSIIANQIMELFEFFVQIEQPLFFIKKGLTCVWLVRKTSGYMFDNLQWPYHRVTFDFVRYASTIENMPLYGKGIKTFVKDAHIV